MGLKDLFKEEKEEAKELLCPYCGQVVCHLIEEVTDGQLLLGCPHCKKIISGGY